MSGINLKHYSSYIKYIRLYAKAIQLKLQFAAVDGDGSYVPSRRIIRVDPDLSESHTIAVLLHELGHVLDDTLMDKATFRKHNKAYTKIYTSKYTSKHKKTVFKTEVRAWEYGRVIAKILGIRLGKWYDKVRTSCLKGYK